MSEERKQVIAELGDTIRKGGEYQALALVSAFVSGYNAAKDADKAKTAADEKPEKKAESEAKAG